MGMYMNTPIIASSVRMNEIANTQFSTVPLRHRLVYTCSDSLTDGKDLDGIGFGQDADAFEVNHIDMDLAQHVDDQTLKVSRALVIDCAFAVPMPSLR
jgi:hypothetical protein